MLLRGSIESAATFLGEKGPAVKAVRLARVAALVVFVGATLLGVAACTLPTRDSRDRYEPVTVSHMLGATTVDKVPKHVVTLGNQWTDNALALGVTPVGFIAPAAGGATPWTPAALESAKTLDTSGSLTEQIAALHPDLILVDGFIADRKTYDELSRIAPTVPALGPEAPWQDQVRMLGRILHKQSAADTLITDVDKTIATITQAAPALRGKTFVTTWLASDTQLLVLTAPDNPTLFTRLGLRTPDHLTELPTSLPPDQVSELDADVLLAGYSPGLDEMYRRLPGYADLPAVRKNSVTFLTAQELSGIAQPTALSVPYLLERLKPALTNAAK
ncbi:ABC transporter substrate-binding protein [Nocardia sp. NBC_01730]|uniref:ABC transporter substrate-binding protein n=1 Tax=Nocardia sp. NBC_01730 TaxID=2975998 RepID=UPI002E13E0D7|nr:ABC transporter substrate-binding protein [Nocardia sp. NBC_01730]